MIGQTISHYKILEKIGEGGMGLVYKAEDTHLDRIVALKFLPEHLAASEHDKARFTQEAKAASALNHPNVCTIHDIQEHEGQLFIVMEHVDGQTLRDKRATISFKQAVDIGIQIADGLAAAHEKGIVHRDIKPENIMIRKDGIAQIMDFGLAKLRGNVSRLTKEGSTVGTAGYMSPEQVQGQDADHRSDIFSLGVMLYELFTGQLPFRGVHETALMYEIVNVDAPPMSSIKPDIDPALDNIILECLEKDPNERAQSARQISIDLKRFKRESGGRHVSRVTAARPVFRPGAPRAALLQKRILWPVISGVLAMALAVVAFLLWNASDTEQTVARLSISLPADQTIPTGSYLALAVSPDGSRIVYRANGKLYQRRLNSFTAEVIPGTDDGSSPFFSPDGRSIGFFADGKLKKTSLSGGGPVILADAGIDNRGGTWLSDGAIVFSPGGATGLYRVSAEGGNLARLTFPDTLQKERTHRWPQGLPDGKTVIFTIGSMDSPDYYEDATIAAVNIRTGEQKVVLQGASRAEHVAAGYLLYSHAGSLFASRFDADQLRVEGSSFPFIDGVSGDQLTGAMHFAVSRNGTFVWIPGQTLSENRELALADLEGRITALPLQPGHYMEPRMSPDGKKVAFVIGSRNDYDVWIYDIPNNTTNRFTFGGPNRCPVWSPDGKRIAYSYNPSGTASIMIKQSDGTGAAEEIKTEQRTYISCWSRDGSTLVLSVPVAGATWDLYTLDLKGDRKLRLWREKATNGLQGVLSPAGRWISYVSRENGLRVVYVRPFPHGDGKWQVSAGEAQEAHWAPDGRTLFYASAQSITAVPITEGNSFIMGRPRVVVREYPWIPVESSATFDIAPDGKHLLITRPREGDSSPHQVNVVLNWFDELKYITASGK